MEIILLEKVQNLGDLGETVTVARGYARNFLIPQKKAVRASEDAKAKVESRRKELAAEASKRVESAQARADLAVREITVTRRVSDPVGGGLYGSVSTADVAAALTEAGCRVDKAEVVLPAGAIKTVGEFSAEVRLHAEVQFSVKIVVQAAAESGESAAAGESSRAD